MNDGLEREIIRENGRNYLCFSRTAGEAESRDSHLEMVRRNRIPGLLTLQREWIDDRKTEKYDVTGYHLLSRWLEIQPLTEAELRNFLMQLKAFLQQLEEYMINEELVSFDPECIFLAPERDEYRFCILPDQSSSEKDSLRSLALFFLDHVATEETKAMQLAVAFYQISGEQEVLEERLGRLLTEEGPELPEEESFEEEPEAEDLLPEEKEKGFLERFFFSLFQRQKRKAFPEEELFEYEEEYSETEENQKRVAVWNQEPTKLLFLEEGDDEERVLLEKETGKRVALDHYPFLIGTLPRNDYKPPFDGISRLHIRIEQDEDGLWVTDLNSTNGTRLNGRILDPGKREVLHVGDILNLAGIVYELR